jgi:hypothetical protein
MSGTPLPCRGAANRGSQRGEPLGRRSLRPPVRGTVVVPAEDLVRRVLLFDNTAREVMRVSVAAAVL